MLRIYTQHKSRFAPPAIPTSSSSSSSTEWCFPNPTPILTDKHETLDLPPGRNACPRGEVSSKINMPSYGGKSVKKKRSPPQDPLYILYNWYNGCPRFPPFLPCLFSTATITTATAVNDFVFAISGSLLLWKEEHRLMRHNNNNPFSFGPWVHGGVGGCLPHAVPWILFFHLLLLCRRCWCWGCFFTFFVQSRYCYTYNLGNWANPPWEISLRRNIVEEKFFPHDEISLEVKWCFRRKIGDKKNSEFLCGYRYFAHRPGGPGACFGFLVSASPLRISSPHLRSSRNKITKKQKQPNVEQQ